MTAPEPDNREPCPRCVFRPCGYAAPGNARFEVVMPDGRTARGWLCRPHQALLGAGSAFGLQLLAGRGGETAPCGWLVPAEEGMQAEDGTASAGDDAAALEEATA